MTEDQRKKLRNALDELFVWGVGRSVPKPVSDLYYAVRGLLEDPNQIAHENANDQS